MTTLAGFAREMIRRAPGEVLGRVEAVASLAVGSVTVTALATGSRPSDEFVGKYMTRRETATAADRVRRISSYTTGTGLLAHSGANYGDTTATNEFVEITLVEPKDIDNAIQMALATTTRLDRETLPTFIHTDYQLNALSWIQSPSDIVRVCYSPNPVLSRDRYMEKWNTVDSSGNQRLDWWTLSGASATYARSTDSRKNGYSVTVTRAGTDAVMTQTVGLLETGVSGDTLRGRTLTFVVVGKTAVASRLRGWASDGTQTVYTSYHTGGNTWEELTGTIAIASTASSLTFGWGVYGGDTTATVTDCYITEIYGPATQRDSWPERDLPPADWRFDQGQLTNALELPNVGRNGQYVIYSLRAWPQFDQARLLAGSADADSSDAWLDTIADAALARLFGALRWNRGEDTSRYEGLAMEFAKKSEQSRLKHLRMDEADRGGLPLPRSMLAPAARRM